jgi:hypothetical protein
VSSAERSREREASVAVAQAVDEARRMTRSRGSKRWVIARWLIEDGVLAEYRVERAHLGPDVDNGCRLKAED